MDKVKELENCPLCRGKASLLYHGEGNCLVSVCCEKCDCESGLYRSIKKAREAWNTRDWHKAEVKREVKKVLEELLSDADDYLGSI